MSARVFKLSFFVPESHVEIVKSALFQIGVGRYQNYDSCCWQTLGEGQFRPLRGSNPYIGMAGEIEKVPEYKVETVCSGELLESALSVLRENHPYEEPSFEYFEINSEPMS